MTTDWDLIRKTLNAVIDACEELEKLNITPEEQGNPAIRWGDMETGVSVGDFLTRFWQYPEGAQRDIIRLRNRLGDADQKYVPPCARALLNTTAACVEIIRLEGETLEAEVPAFVSHCDSGGTSIHSQIEGIPNIYQNWMLPEITRALGQHRGKGE